MKRAGSPASEEERATKKLKSETISSNSFMATGIEVLAWVREGQIDELRNWLQSADVKSNAADEDMIAAQHRQDVFGEGSFAAGMSFLLWAVDGKNLEMCDLLLKYYPGLLDHGDSEGLTPLHYASLNGDSAVVTALLEKGAALKEDHYGDTPLHLAALNGHHDVVKLLLGKGANPNAKGQNGATPLHNAVVNKQVKVIGILLGSQIVDFNIKDNKGKTPKVLAIEGGDKTVIDYFEVEKREKLERIQELAAELAEYKERLSKYEERRESDQRAIGLAYKRLKDEEDAHKLTKDELTKLKEETRSRTLTEHEERYLLLQNEMLALKASNLELTGRLQALSKSDNENSMKIDTKITDTHRALSNLLALFETTNLAILSAKNEIEGVRQLVLKPPNPDGTAES